MVMSLRRSTTPTATSTYVLNTENLCQYFLQKNRKQYKVFIFKCYVTSILNVLYVFMQCFFLSF